LLLYSQREKVAALPGQLSLQQKRRGSIPNNLSVREVPLHCTKTSTKNSQGFDRELPRWFSGKLGMIGGTPDFVKVFVFHIFHTRTEKCNLLSLFIREI